jgi:PTS system nitrogen regulatory IIA component
MQLTVADVSELLRIPPKQIYRWIDEGELECKWFHNQPRFNRTEILEWATARRIPIAINQFLDDEESEETTPNFTEGLKAGGVHRNVSGTDRESVLRAVVDLMKIPEIEKDTLVQVLLAHEAAGSTGIGNGIAIPHARQPVVMGGVPASIALCFLSQPVDFAAIDSGPVHTLFLIVSTTVRGHLQSLAQLSSALHDPVFKNAILERASTEKILQEASRIESAFPHVMR